MEGAEAVLSDREMGEMGDAEMGMGVVDAAAVVVVVVEGEWGAGVGGLI